MDFSVLPSGALTLKNLRTPACLLAQDGDLTSIELTIENGHITSGKGTEVDMGGAMVFPTFTDMHTHLDKGHIWGRAPNRDGTFTGALDTVAADRAANWSAEDVRRRMAFSLRCAFAHGTSAIRTHLDSLPPQDEISFPVFREMRAEWAGLIDLQAACLVAIDNVSEDGPYARTADIVAESGGVLGMVAFPVPDLRERVRAFFRMADARGLETDMHVDESVDPTVATLRVIAETKLEMGVEMPLTVGHCCSLSVQDEAEAMQTLDLLAKAGINVVSLPMCNMYLQDRHAHRTPRLRGVTLVHEMRARGINVSFASDNTRDPFYAYGDLDMIEVMRQATRIAHLDHTGTDWPHAFLTNPARACGFAAPSLAPGAPADLVICKARSWTELFARPQSDRIVLRAGQAIDRALPDYAELDDLMR
ncbi:MULTISPECIES: cytosine deaminase [Actibacterium]|uniref:Cytosine deaminase n=1 Tax=Actibacterium naphthalenivorans TaxID=1614693 RepID=A0A840C6X8_9RHOB|nr:MULTISPECIES: cytosine deaminase [Actibacterium]ALG89523.1 cytosine deaminase [Actibacterium sp. EMB200-NS6]MBB4020830.1 cytosine deaminase [Actibacterium naphthalenivorans]